ncbi:O-acetyl-ADP-ribose deacetylase [Clostridium sp. HCS.1]|uniref:O-acetyl-ADP-ribose deacetylase n=1 Tax=Clostridium sp. HCS.1 TaxID=3238594 RepID=UPI003A0FF050
MPFEIIRNDITKVHADAIVNAANTSLLGGGGVDGAIHAAAGPELLKECRTLGGCAVGEAKITKAYNLPAKYIIHTVGPIWRGGNNNEEELLRNCYKNSLQLVKDYKLEIVAFPIISAGAYGYPKDEALKIAISVIGDFLLSNDLTIYLVVYDKNVFMLSNKLLASIKEYIDDRYVEEHTYSRNRYEETYLRETECIERSEGIKPRRLEDILINIDETFSEMLLRLIDEKNMKEVEVYKRANIDRRLFSKIKKDKNYKPSKATAIAFSIALKLNLDETKDLLLKAGFALSHSSKFDIIIEYFIENQNYDIFEINEALFDFNQSTLGS